MTGQTRLFDPATSYAAARVIGQGVENAVYRMYCLIDEGLTDDELCGLLDEFHPPTLKSARSRLSKRGVLKDSGARRKSNRGQQMVVWQLAS